MSNRKIRKRSKNATNRALEIWVAGFWWKSIFGSFSHFQAIWPLWFSENHLFGARNPSIFNNITDSLSECLEIVIRPTKKAYLLPHRSRNQQDGWCRPTGNNQCLKLHDHLTTIDARSSSAIKASYVQKKHQLPSGPSPYKQHLLGYYPFLKQFTNWAQNIPYTPTIQQILVNISIRTISVIVLS